jgi:hypothetical protein
VNAWPHRDMAAGWCSSPESPAASARRPRSAWPRWEHLAFTGRDTEHTQAASDEIRTAAAGLRSTCSSPALAAQAEVRRLADEMSQRLPVRRLGDENPHHHLASGRRLWLADLQAREFPARRDTGLGEAIAQVELHGAR